MSGKLRLPHTRDWVWIGPEAAAALNFSTALARGITGFVLIFYSWVRKIQAETELQPVVWGFRQSGSGVTSFGPTPGGMMVGAAPPCSGCVNLFIAPCRARLPN